jgi:type I restriction enzyme M protein
VLSPQLERDIRQLWNHFWSGGIANPLTAIEQITYLVFLKRLEDLSHEPGRSSEFSIPDECRWSNIKHLTGKELLDRVGDTVFKWLRSLDVDGEERMQNAVFAIPNAMLLRRAIDIIDKLFVPSRNQDALGDIYEHLLNEIAEAGKNGQFRTPRHIIRAMCDLVDPQYGERICDPACGTGGFLVNAYQHILKTNTNPEMLVFEGDGTPLNVYGDRLSTEQHQHLRSNSFYGYDFDRTMVRLGWMNLIQHGIENPKVNYGNTLGSAFNQKIQSGEVGNFDVVLANPPFTGSLDKTDIGETLQELKTTKTELLFLELILQLLRIGGRAAVIVPEGVLFGSSKAHKTLREKLVAENTLKAVISLPGGVFQPYTGVKTSILVFDKGGKTDEVWFYEVAKDGETLDAKRNPKPEENDLWDLTLKYRLQFESSAPMFVDGDTWKQWQEMEPKTRSVSYARPIIEEEWVRPDEPEPYDLKKVLPLLHLWWKWQQEIQKQQPIDTEKQNLWHISLVYHLISGIATFAVDIFEGLETEALIEAKNWSASTEYLTENDYSLSAGRYKPLTLTVENHDSPGQIISELQALENEIQSKLNLLLSMVQGRE